MNLQGLCGQFYNNINTSQVYVKPTYLLSIYLFAFMTMVWDMQETITRWYMKSDASSPYLAISALIEVITIMGTRPQLLLWVYQREPLH